MNTIQAFEQDIMLEPTLVESFTPQTPISPLAQNDCVFCGSGDSLSAVMLAEAFSDYRIRSLDPLDALKNKNLLSQKHPYLVSISGNTISNIDIAKHTSSTAITAHKNSRLASACSETILLSYPSCGVYTAGVTSYLASSLTCISLASKITIPDVGKIFDSARHDAKQFALSQNVYVLGNYLTYPISMYCAAKIYEVLGGRSVYTRTEQFSHMELFSTRKDDTIIVLESDSPHTRNLLENLGTLDQNVIHPNICGDSISQALYAIFFSQFLVLNEAKSRGLSECYFLDAGETLGASSAMIY